MLDELQLTYTSYNGQNLNSPAVSVIRGSTVLKWIFEKLYAGMDRIDLAQDRDRWWALVNAVMNLRVSKNSGN
jgi:hypothetical protein